MKKWIALLMAMTMMFCVMACGSKATQTDLEYVKEKGTLIVGITDFAPMDYKDENGNWVGFDAELATAFAESIGVEVKFEEIEWGNKILEVQGKNIDCVWNGMTLSPEVKQGMDCSNSYCNNVQVVIVPASEADKYQTIEDLSGLKFAVESGSAGEAEALKKQFDVEAFVENQASALMEVKAGTSDAAIIDYLMASAMVGEGTSYEDLAYTVVLNQEEGEEYGVGFRKGSNLVEELNKFLKDAYKDGSMLKIAEKYNIKDRVIAQ